MPYAMGDMKVAVQDMCGTVGVLLYRVRDDGGRVIYDAHGEERHSIGPAEWVVRGQETILLSRDIMEKVAAEIKVALR